jgi:hypothetical protein
MVGRFANRPYALSGVERAPVGEQNRTSARIEKGLELAKGRRRSEMADLSDYGVGGRNGFFVPEKDRGGWGQWFLRSTLRGLGLSGHAQLTGPLALRLGHVTSLPSVPRRGARPEARSSGGGGKHKHSCQ